MPWTQLDRSRPTGTGTSGVRPHPAMAPALRHSGEPRCPLAANGREWGLMTSQQQEIEHVFDLLLPSFEAASNDRTRGCGMSADLRIRSRCRITRLEG